MSTARLPIDAAHRAASSDAHPIGAVTGLTDALAGKAAVAHETALTGVHGIVRKGPNLRSVGIGDGAALNTTVDTSVAIGYYAGFSNTTGVQTAIGYLAGRYNTTGYQTAIGHQAGYANTTGTQTAIGHAAGYANTTGTQTAIGYAAGYANTTGTLTAVGYTAGYSNTTGYITAVGHAAGRYLADGTTPNETPAGGTYIGQDTRASVASAANETVIGYAAIGGGSNTVRLGNASVTNWLPGDTNKVAIGSNTLAFKELYLHDGTDEWKVTINTSGVLTTTKV
jgi:hypothetical protein